jgi:hypothetical protein
MKESLKLKHYTAISILLCYIPFALQANDTTKKYTKIHVVSDVTKNPKLESEVNINSLATEAIVDTNDKFEAILFDNQSQITYGKLYWDKNSSIGAIKFEHEINADEIQLHISDINEIEPSERYSVLLSGLHEAGVAQFSATKVKAYSSIKRHHVNDIASSQITPMGVPTTGAFDASSTQHIVRGALNMDLNITRTASGWGFDPDRPSESTWIHFYGRRGRSQQLEYVGAVLANQSRPDVNSAYGISGLHGWSAPIPEGWDIDNNKDVDYECEPVTMPIWGIYYRCQVEFYGYVIDRTGDGNSRLVNSPYVISTTFPQRP